MKIAVRMDDITPDMDWERFRWFEELFEQYGIKPLIGIVPMNLDENLHKEQAREDFWEYMRELEKKGWVIALHGANHVYTTKKGGLFPLNHFSEFAGVPYKKQRQALEQADSCLKEHGIMTNIFMPPAHSFDQNTLRALIELGYTSITDGFGKQPYFDRGMKFYPISFKLSSSLKKQNGYTTMVIHANTTSQQNMEEYRNIFAKHSQKFISYEEYLKVPVKKRKIVARFWEWLLANVKHTLVAMKSKL